MWARAMETYDRVAKDIAPKKAKLAEAEASYGTVMSALKIKQADLQKVLDKVQALNDKLDGLKQEQKDLAFQVFSLIYFLNQRVFLVITYDL